MPMIINRVLVVLRVVTIKMVHVILSPVPEACLEVRILATIA